MQRRVHILYSRTRRDEIFRSIFQRHRPQRKHHQAERRLDTSVDPNL